MTEPTVTAAEKYCDSVLLIFTNICSMSEQKNQNDDYYSTHGFYFVDKRVT